MPISSGKTSSGSSVSDGGISDAGIDSVVPAFYFATPINKETTFGFAVTSPYGLATKYDKAWAGRYQAIDSAITTVNFNPTISYKIDPKLSVGAGLQAQYMSATLTNMVDYGSALGAAGSDDRLAKINGTDWGYGYNFGVNYKFNDKTKFGVGYRSKIDHKLEGRAEVNGLQYGNFNSSVTTPESVWTLVSEMRVSASSSFTNLVTIIASSVSTTSASPNERTNLGVNNIFLVSLGSAFVLLRVDTTFVSETAMDDCFAKASRI